MNKSNPYDFDWGNITPDGFDEVNNVALFVFNFDVSASDSIEMSKVFCYGKIVWATMNIPKCNYRLVWDLRGQPLTFIDRARKMKKELIESLAEFREKFVEVNIEILI